MDASLFRAWQAHMGLDGHGGQKRTAELLGMSIGAIRIYEKGERPDGTPINRYPKTIDLACSALAMGLKPWSEFER
jgi:hypothetical protein